MRLFCRKTGARVFGLPALALALAMFASPITPPAQAQVSVGISVNFAPPALPVYEQPPCPGEGYIWTPGYWAWDPDYGDYYWVPGTWVFAPQPGFLWTPPWWGWNGVAFVFHEGYWGPRVGFYGGIDYGYGYTSRGYYGGRWDHDRFYYNRNVNNVNVTQIRNVYNTTVVNNVNVTRVSYNGGNGGIQQRATAQEEQAERERHVRAVAAQQQHIQEARADRALRASDNRGKPPIAATDKPAQFRGGKVVAAKAGNYTPPPNRAPNASRPEANRAPNANRPAPTPAPNANHPNARPNEKRSPENRSDRPPNASRPAPTPNANPPGDRPAPHANPRPNSNANPNRPEATRPTPDPNPPRATPNTPSRPPKATDPNTNERRQQGEQRMKQQEQQRQRAEQQQNQERAREQQQQKANQERKQQQEQERQHQQPKAQPKPQPKPQQRPQPKQQPPKQEQQPDGQKPPHGAN